VSNSLKLQPIRRRLKLKEVAYRRVKGLLLGGKMQSGSIISASKVAQALGISRTPVREALLEVVHEGLLKVIPHRGFMVPAMSLSEAREVFWLRRVLERAIVREICGKLGPEDFKELENMVQFQESAIAESDAVGFLEYDIKFHLALAERTGFRHLIAIMRNVRDLTMLLGAGALTQPGRMVEVVDEHRAIVEALRQQDRGGAEKAMEAHLARTYWSVGAFLSKTNSPLSVGTGLREIARSRRKRRVFRPE